MSTPFKDGRPAHNPRRQAHTTDCSGDPITSDEIMDTAKQIAENAINETPEEKQDVSTNPNNRPD